MEPGQGDDKSHVPAPSLLPVAFAIGLVIVLVGLIISNWIAVGIGAVIAFAFGSVWIATCRPAGPRKPAAASTHEASRRVHVGDRSDDRGGRALPRDRFLEGATLGLGAVIGAIVTIPPLALLTASGFEGRASERRLGALEVPGRQVHHRPSWRIELGSLANTAYIRNNASSASCRASRSSRTTAHLGCPVQPTDKSPRTGRKRSDKRGTSSCLSRRCSRPASGARAAASRHGRQPHRRPAGSRARPVHVLDRRRPPDPRQRLQRRQGQARADAKIKKTRLSSRGSTSTGRIRSGGRNPREGQRLDAVRTPEADGGRRPLSARLARGGRGSSARPGISSSASCPATAAGRTLGSAT